MSTPSKKPSHLHLERRRGETVLIGEGSDMVEVIVGRTQDGSTMLHIYAPRHIKVDRLERRRDQEKVEARRTRLNGED